MLSPDKHAELPAHVVRGFHLVSERRAPKHPFVAAGAKQIREIRMTVRKLKNGQFSRETRDMIRRKRRELADVELFSLADGTRFLLAR